MADGAPARDTIPAMPVRHVKGIQSERDGALIPDAYNELPWPMVRVEGDRERLEYLHRATQRHLARQCMGGECGEFGRCSRHGALDEVHAERCVTVAEASLQLQVILTEAAKRTASHERDTRLQLLDDILHELRFAMGLGEAKR